MFVGFLDGTLAPGGMLGESEEVGYSPRARRSRRSVRVLKVHATRTTSPSPEPPPTPTDRPSDVGRGPHRADRVHRDDPRSVGGGRRSQLPTGRSRKGKRSCSACSWSSTTSRATRRPCGSRRASPGRRDRGGGQWHEPVASRLALRQLGPGRLRGGRRLRASRRRPAGPGLNSSARSSVRRFRPGAGDSARRRSGWAIFSLGASATRSAPPAIGRG